MLGRVRLIEDIIFPLVDEFSRSSTTGIPFVRDPDAVLFGPQGVLDSLGLVSFLVEVEARVESVVGKPVRLVSERALSATRSPFQSVSLLADYVLDLIGGPPL